MKRTALLLLAIVAVSVAATNRVMPRYRPTPQPETLFPGYPGWMRSLREHAPAHAYRIPDPLAQGPGNRQIGPRRSWHGWPVRPLNPPPGRRVGPVRPRRG